MPAAKPADRSISPSSRTKTSPIASTMIAAPWLIRFAKLPFDRNVSPSMKPKIATRTTTPMIAGSEPMSPPLTRAQYSRAAWPIPPSVVLLDVELGDGCRRSAHPSPPTLVAATSGLRPMSPERPAVISSTTWPWVTSLA